MARLARISAGLGTNLYRLGVPEKDIQAILRHANVDTTLTYYVKLPPRIHRRQRRSWKKPSILG